MPFDAGSIVCDLGFQFRKGIRIAFGEFRDAVGNAVTD
jgi:hypothetical protein